jgi:hypothetical protein
LTAEGFELDVRAPAVGDGPAATAELAAALRAAEAALEEAPPACALVIGSGDAALGAALTAVKLEIPAVWIAPADASGDAGLTGRVADLTLDATEDAATAARAIRDLAMPKLPSP